MSAQKWVLGSNSAKLAHLVAITSRIYTVKNVSSAYQPYPPNYDWLVPSYFRLKIQCTLNLLHMLSE